jgi:hypothetical protein
MSFPIKPGIKKPMPKDEDGNPNDADDKLIAKRKKLVALVAGGAGMKGPC